MQCVIYYDDVAYQCKLEVCNAMIHVYETCACGAQLRGRTDRRAGPSGGSFHSGSGQQGWGVEQSLGPDPGRSPGRFCTVTVT